MSKAEQDFDRDVRRIIDELGDVDLGDNHDANIEDILKENEDDYLPSLLTEKNTFLDYTSSSKENGKAKHEMKTHPLKLIETHEKDITSKLGWQSDLESKFLLSNYSANFNSNYPIISYKPSDTVNNYCFPEQNGKQTANSKDFFGTPRCLAVRNFIIKISNVFV